MKYLASLIVVAGVVLAGAAQAKTPPKLTVHLNDEAVQSGKCEQELNVHFAGTVTTTEPMKVVYEWRHSDGKKVQQSLDFTAAGTQDVSFDWAFKKKYTGWIQIYIAKPSRFVHVKTNKTHFTVKCG